jgi:hypothetical protein
MAGFQGNRINPTRFSRGQIKFHNCITIINIYDPSGNIYDK